MVEITCILRNTLHLHDPASTNAHKRVPVVHTLADIIDSLHECFESDVMDCSRFFAKEKRPGTTLLGNGGTDQR